MIFLQEGSLSARHKPEREKAPENHCFTIIAKTWCFNKGLLEINACREPLQFYNELSTLFTMLTSNTVLISFSSASRSL